MDKYIKDLPHKHNLVSRELSLLVWHRPELTHCSVRIYLEKWNKNIHLLVYGVVHILQDLVTQIMYWMLYSIEHIKATLSTNNGIRLYQLINNRKKWNTGWLDKKYTVSVIFFTDELKADDITQKKSWFIFRYSAFSTLTKSNQEALNLWRSDEVTTKHLIYLLEIITAFASFQLVH